MFYRFILSLLVSTFACVSFCFAEDNFRLSIDSELNLEAQTPLPTSNFWLSSGYIHTPSARAYAPGTAGFSFSYSFPYKSLNAAIQPFERIQLNGNLRVFEDIPSLDLGEGYGDKSDKGMGIKLLLLKASDWENRFCDISIGADDFLGTKAFKSFYVVASKLLLENKCEVSFGWGTGLLKGPFGAIAVFPFEEHLSYPFERLTFMLEYDATQYKNGPYARDLKKTPVKQFIENKQGLDHYEHLNNRLKTKSPINLGTSVRVFDLLDFTCAWTRGKSLSGQVSITKDLDNFTGFAPKLDQKLPFTSPVNHSPLGSLRTITDLPFEFVYAFKGQGMTLKKVMITGKKKRSLCLEVINDSYIKPGQFRERLLHLLATLVPSNVQSVLVQVNHTNLHTLQYTFTKEELLDFKARKINAQALFAHNQAQEPIDLQKQENIDVLYQRKDPIFEWAFRPSFSSSWGSSRGKFKAGLGLNFFVNGYILPKLCYQGDVSFDLLSNLSGASSIDKNNPSQIINVHSDVNDYLKKKQWRINTLFLQSHDRLVPKHYYRVSGGYFEIAYAGIGAEYLYAPIDKNFAIGLEASVLKKRAFSGLALTNKVRKLEGFTASYQHFTGYQGFLDFYYKFPSINSFVKLGFGQFLAKDRGVKTEFTKTFESGVELSTWLAVTNGQDYINKSRYHNYGFSISLPLDFITTKSKKTLCRYGMSAWLRDVGYRANTGQSLYEIINEER